jgi:hypothetical protein
MKSVGNIHILFSLKPNTTSDFFFLFQNLLKNPEALLRLVSYIKRLGFYKLTILSVQAESTSSA